MHETNRKNIFLLYHLFLLVALLFCWSSVAYSYFYFKDIHEGMSIREHLDVLNRWGGLRYVFVHPVVTVIISITSVLIFLSFKSKNFLRANSLLLVSTGVILFQYNYYLITASFFDQKFVFFSYLGLLIYTGKILVVLLIQLLVFGCTAKVLKFWSFS